MTLPHAGRRTPREFVAHHGRLNVLAEIILVALVFVLSFLIITTFVLTGFKIPSTSMERTLDVGDTILVWKPYNLNGGLNRGQIVVFQDPGRWVTGDTTRSEYVVKRIIGLPGDHVRCCNALGQITINGAAVNESVYLPGDTAPSDTPFDVVVPAGKLFVLGDNREKSNDSRYQDPQFVPMERVTGVAFAKYWPKFAGLPDASGVFAGVPKP